MDLLQALSLACPGCKEGLTAAQAQAFEWSIYLMLGLVYGIIGVLAAVVWRTSRREAAAQTRS